MTGGVAFPHGSKARRQGTPLCRASDRARARRHRRRPRTSTGPNTRSILSSPDDPGHIRPRFTRKALGKALGRASRCPVKGRAGLRSRPVGVPTRRHLAVRTDPANPGHIRVGRRVRIRASLGRTKVRPGRIRVHLGRTKVRPGNTRVRLDHIKAHPGHIKVRLGRRTDPYPREPMDRKDNRRTTAACRRPANHRCSAPVGLARLPDPVRRADRKPGSPVRFTGVPRVSGRPNHPGPIRRSKAVRGRRAASPTLRGGPDIPRNKDRTRVPPARLNPDPARSKARARSRSRPRPACRSTPACPKTHR